MFLINELSDEAGVFVQIYDISAAQETSFPTSANLNFQVGIAVNESQRTYPAHIHTKLERTITGTSEFILVLEGQMDVVFLREDEQPAGSASLTAQMAFLQVRGGHAIKTNANTRFIEIKQGPYQGHDADKYAIPFPAGGGH